jgi:hypothetical protein
MQPVEVGEPSMDAQLPVIGVISCRREVEGGPAQATRHRDPVRLRAPEAVS